MKRILTVLSLVFLSTVSFGQSEKTYRTVKEAVLDSLNVKILSLSGDSLIVLPIEMLKLRNLEELSLQSKNLNFNQAINLLSQFPRLRQLWFFDVDVLNLKGISKLQALENLTLKGVGITLLPIEIMQLSNLREIDISDNPKLNLVQAFDVLSEIKNLKSLYINDANLTDLPKEITKLKYLEELYLDNNEFSKIPQSIKKLKIKYLSFFGNKMQVLNLEKGDFASLTDINLCGNNFKIFPATKLSLIPNLETVIMWQANVEYIPKQIADIKKLKWLNLEKNNISKLPSQIAELKYLNYLRLSDNDLTTKGITPVFSITWLEVLDLQGNKIDYLDSRIRNLKNVKELYIGDNPLSKLPTQLFSLNKVKWLSIGMLPNLPWEETFVMLGKMQSIKKLSLFFNHYKTVPKGLLKLKQVKFLIINGNGFDEKEQQEIRDNFPGARVAF